MRTNKLACLALGASIRESRRDLSQSGSNEKKSETDSQNNNLVDMKPETCEPIKDASECKNGHGCDETDDAGCENNNYSAVHVPSSYNYWSGIGRNGKAPSQEHSQMKKEVEKPTVPPVVVETQPIKKVKNKDKVRAFGLHNFSSFRCVQWSLRSFPTISN